jgi:NTE family protein
MEGVLRLGQFNIERILEEFLPETVARRFEDLKIPTKIMVTDYYGHAKWSVRQRRLAPCGCRIGCHSGRLPAGDAG